MPKLKKADIEDIDFGALDEATYSDGEFQNYEGEIPPAGTILDMFVKKMWWTRTKPKVDETGNNVGNKPAINVLLEAAGNQDDEEEYNGLAIWEFLTLTPGGKFRWGPFFELFGLVASDVRKIVVGEPDNNGTPIERMAAFVPGSEDSWCRVVTKIGFDQNGIERAEIKKLLPYDDEDLEPEEDLADEVDEAEDIDDEVDEVDEAGDIDDEDIEDEDEDLEVDEEPEPEPEPAPRGRKAPARPAPARTARAAPEPATTGAKARSGARTGKATAPAAGPATARATARRAAPARTAPARAKPARTKAAAYGDEPPF